MINMSITKHNKTTIFHNHLTRTNIPSSPYLTSPNFISLPYYSLAIPRHYSATCPLENLHPHHHLPHHQLFVISHTIIYCDMIGIVDIIFSLVCTPLLHVQEFLGCLFWLMYVFLRDTRKSCSFP